MVARRLLIVVCCLVVWGAPLADSLCFADCANSEASGTHHACVSERDDTTANNAAPHACPVGDEATLRGVEVRHAIAGLAPPPRVRFDPPLPNVSFTRDARFTAADPSHQIHTPLRL